jgi:hypothetical protein
MGNGKETVHLVLRREVLRGYAMYELCVSDYVYLVG